MKYEILSIEAWRYEEGWIWNNSWVIKEVEFKDVPTTRQILKALRDNGTLSDFSKGRVTIDHDQSPQFYEIQDRNTNEPMCALRIIDEQKAPVVVAHHKKLHYPVA